MVHAGKSLYIAEQRFGNEGYVLYFKIKELLGSQEGHVFGCRNPSDWEFLLAITRLNGEKCEQIMELFATLEFIDADLWRSERTIWCPELMNDLKEVYKNRKRPLPEKPIIVVSTPETPVSTVGTTGNGGLSAQKPTEGGVSTPDNPQSKVEYINPPISPPDGKPAKRGKRVKVEIDYDLEISKALNTFVLTHQTAIKGWMSVVASLNKSKTIAQSRYLTLLGELGGALAATTPAIFESAVREATTRGKGSVGYIKAIIETKNLDQGKEPSNKPSAAAKPPALPDKPQWMKSSDGRWRPNGAPYSHPGLTDEEFDKIRNAGPKVHPSVQGTIDKIMGGTPQGATP
jgi:hypothetical protein